jgi:hypothetical protein
VTGGAAGGGNTAGGNVTITSGAGAGSGTGGSVAIAGGAAGTTAGTYGANVSISGGNSATTGATALGGNITLSGGLSTAGTGGGIYIVPGTGGTKGVFAGTKAAYSGGVQALTGTGGAYTIAADGSSLIRFTAGTSATTTATITGCNSGLYPQGAILTIMVVGGGAWAMNYTDTAVAAATADQIVLSGAYATGATTSTTARGSTITLMCTTVITNKVWVEVARMINAS